MRFWPIAAIVTGIVASLTWGADEAKPLHEDLPDSLYTQGETLIPVPDHRDAAKNGYIFRFEKQEWERLPTMPRGLEPDRQAPWLVQTMREKNTGDVLFIDRPQVPPAVMVVVSGKVRDLGKHFLHDFHDKVLDAPTEWPPVDAAKGVPVSGWVQNPEAGHVFLIETVDAKHVLFRIVARGKGGIYIQWVSPEQKMTAKWDLRGGLTSIADKADVKLYPPEPNTTTRSTAVAVASSPGTTAIRPVARTQPVRPPVATDIAYAPIRPSVVDPLGPIPGPDRVAAVMREREALIRDRLTMLARDAKTGRDQRAKAQAFVELGQLGAIEAADALVGQVSFIDTGDSALTGETLKIHPAVGALIKIGKPGSAAAIKGLHELKPNNNPIMSPTYRTMLLSMVIRRVEGDEVAEFLLKRELDKADTEHKPFFEQAIKELKTPSSGAGQ